MGRDEHTVGDLLRQGRQALAEAAGFEPSLREANLLLRHVLGLGEASLLARRDEAVTADAAARFREFLARRLRGEPVAYLLGEREFYGRPFAVDPRVLIPRPETEHLVEAALALELPASPRILDLGTGSGVIAVTLALEIPGSRVVATDLSLAALQVLRSNVRRHAAEGRVAAVGGDLGAALRLDRFDLVVSNPPYVDPREAAELSPEVRDFEPHLALFAPGSGRRVLERLLDEARSLRPGVHLLLEIGYDQSEWLRAAVAGRRHLEPIEIVRDYGDIPRTAVLRRRSPSSAICRRGDGASNSP